MERDGSAPAHPAGRAAPLGPVAALSALLAFAAFALLAPAVVEIVPGTPLPAPLADHHQDAETLLFAIAFIALLPAAVLSASRICDRIAAGANAATLPALVALLACALALALIAARLADPSGWARGGGALVAAGLVWWALAAALLWRAGGPRSQGLLRLASNAARLWLAAAALTVAVALSFAELASISLPVALAGAAFVLAADLAQRRLRLPALSRRAGALADALVLAFLVLAVPNVVVFGTGGPDAAFETAIIQFHQNFFLGPANQVIAGDAMLVDVLSQYGVGSIYFLAGLFELIPIGNGTLGLIEGALSVLMFSGAYATMRLASVSRILAAPAIAIAVVVGVWGLQFPLGGLLQHGAFRFGLPVGILLGAVAELRWPRHASAARALQLLTLGVASIWALEAFAYCLLTLAAVAAVRLALAGRSRLREELGRWVVQAAGACVAAHLLLAAATVIAAGELPRWGWYLNTLREFLVGPIGDLTYDFSAWSPGPALGAAYLASAAAMIQLLRRRPAAARAEAKLLVAIAGSTGFGVALLSYIVNRSADHIVAYVSLPAFMLAALWLALLHRPALGAPALARRAGVAVALAVSVLLVAAAASTVEQRFAESALGHARPGGASLRVALERLWDPPPLKASAAEGQRLLAEQMPGEERSAVLTSADLAIEILIRSGRGSAIPLGDPFEDSFVPDEHLEPLGEWVQGLGLGERLLVDEPAREAYEKFRRRPGIDPLSDTLAEPSIVPTGLASLQRWVLAEIARGYRLRTVAAGAAGLEVVELVPAPRD